MHIGAGRSDNTPAYSPGGAVSYFCRGNSRLVMDEDDKGNFRLERVNPFSARPSLYVRRLILTYKDGPRSERNKIFLTAVDT